MPTRSTRATLDTFLSRQGIDLARANLFGADAARLELAKGDPKHTLELLRAYQRLHRIAKPAESAAAQRPDPFPPLADPAHDWTDALIARGITSACHAAAMPEFQFVAELAGAFGGAEAAAAFHRSATARASAARHVWANLKDSIGSPHYRATRFYNAAPSLEASFAGMPSFQDLFGTLDYIACPHCASIFSPAAYFLDLMRIVDLYVTMPNAGTIPLKLRLAERRPDLFERKLDCHNTDVPVPFLSIVIDVLGRRIESEVGGDARQAVAIASYPLGLPYNEPLFAVREQLTHLGTSLAQLYRQFGAADAEAARESLGMSAETAKLVGTVAADAAAVAALYGYTQLDAGELAKVSVFTERTGLTRVELGELLGQGMTAAELDTLAAGFFINAGEGTPYMRIVVDCSDPANPFEKIANVTTNRFDRLNRFVRLARIAGWSFADTDWVMVQAMGATTIADAIPGLAAVQRLRDRTGVATDAAAALFHKVKNVGRAGSPPADLFDRVFNAPALLMGDPYKSGSNEPFDPAQPLTWDINGTAAQDNLIRRRLIAALGLSDNDLTLVASYVGCLTSKGTTLETDLATLSALHRLARMADLAKVTVADYLTILRLTYDPARPCADRPPKQATFTVADVEHQLDVLAWTRASGFAAGHLQYVITGVAAQGFEMGYDPAAIGPFVNALATLSAPSRVTASSFVFESLDADKSVKLFQGLVAGKVLTAIGVLHEKADFTVISGLLPASREFAASAIGEADSRAAFVELVERKLLLDPSGVGSGVLSPEFNADTDLSWLFKDDALKRDQVRSILLQLRRNIEHTLQVLASFESTQKATAEEGVAGFFSTDAAMLAVLVPIAAGVDDLGAYLPLMLTPIPPLDPVPAELLQLMATLGRGIHLVRMLRLTASELAGILAQPRAFGVPGGVLASFRDLTLEEVRTFWTFKQLQAAFKDNDESLLAFFAMPDGTQDEENAKLLALAGVTGWNAAQIAKLATLFWGTGKEYGTVAGVERLRQAFALGAASGLSTESLAQLASLGKLVLDSGAGIDAAVWAQWQQSASATLAAVNARIGDSAFADVLKGLRGRSQTALRNAYAPYLLWRLNTWNKAFTRISDLYRYLLIDVEMTSCDSISYIAQGIASVQLYLQRCHLGIEDGIASLPIPKAWWSWMSQYRMWEVNRKVFLYPENYVDPTLRHARTPQFAKLQEALLQSDVRDDTAQDAMRSYLDGFATLAGLRIVASYRIDVTDEAGGEPIDTLFLIGRTATSPGDYYWRTVKQYRVAQDAKGAWTTRADWGPWQKVGVAIPADLVTPVYVFGKLMLFWVELEEVTGSVVSESKSEDHTVWTASLRYSFTDFRSSWVAAQTAQKTVVDFVPDTEYLDKISIYLPDTLSPKHLWWRKVNVVHVPAGHSDVNVNNALEQLVLFYGNALAFYPGHSLGVHAPSETDPFPERLELNREINDADVLVNSLGQLNSIRGSVVTKKALAMPSNLLAARAAAVLLDHPPNRETVAPYAPLSSYNSLYVHEVPSVIFADSYCDEQLRPKAIAVERNIPASPAVMPLLLGTIAADNRAIWVVKNQPGWFVYDNGDDVFLSASQQAGLRRVSDIVTATSSLQPFAPPALYLYTWAYTSDPQPLGDIKFAFTRLGTHTIAALSQRLFTGGIASLLSIEAQRTPELAFSRLTPGANVLDTTRNQLDFDGALGPYFWEVFFHSVFLVAQRLTQAKRYEEAKRWYEYVFDPTAKDDGIPTQHPFDRFWRFLPFRDFTQESLTGILTSVEQIAAYQRDPFDPDAIARLRGSAYPKATVMRYIDNLIQWGDALFAQDTRESITQAVNLYLLASDLLGRRPENVRVFKQPASKSYAEIRALYDTTGTAQAGALAAITLATTTASAVDSFYNGLPIQITSGTGAGQMRTIASYVGATRVATVITPWATVPDATSQYHIFSVPQFLIELENTPTLDATPHVAGGELPYNDINAYFCVPENEELIAWWDTVEDRLFKVRHCMNIKGVERPLALFEPPLDVRSVIRAAGASGGLSVEHNATQPIPFYRFEFVIERAKELTATLASLGSSLLNALQSADAEALTVLRSTQERAILDLTTQIRTDQVNETIENRAALAASAASAKARLDYYNGLVTAGLSSFELANLQAMSNAMDSNVTAGIMRTAASFGYAIPQFGSPFAMTYGGQQVGSVLSAVAGFYEIEGFVANHAAQRSDAMGGFGRRRQDWVFQALLAGHDGTQIARQVAANQIERRIAERELAVHQRNIEQNQALDDFYRRKFSNRELYEWMAGRASSVYFQTYTLALDLARAAQSAYQYETNTAETFIQYDYRDTAYRGLYAGEGLTLSLNQMQWNWLNKRGRTLEIEKTISLARVNPKALLDLREKGECKFELSELLFDLDFPGHYCRKIKSISLTIPAIVGPYQNVKATLTQLSNQIVLTNRDVDAVRFLLGENPSSPPGADKLRTNWWINQQVALSSGVNDAGLFELNFSDPRYLPFEGTGVVSSWSLSMPRAANRIDYGSLSDVVISLKYTALDGGADFRGKVVALDPVKSYAGGRMFLLSQQFPADWFAFMRSQPTDHRQAITFELPAAIVPPHVDGAELTGVYLQLLANVDAAKAESYIDLRIPGVALAIPVTIGARNAGLVTRTVPDFGGAWTVTFNLDDAPGKLKKDGFIDPAVVKDLALIAYFKGDLEW